MLKKACQFDCFTRYETYCEFLIDENNPNYKSKYNDSAILTSVGDYGVYLVHVCQMRKP